MNEKMEIAGITWEQEAPGHFLAAVDGVVMKIDLELSFLRRSRWWLKIDGKREELHHFSPESAMREAARLLRAARVPQPVPLPPPPPPAEPTRLEMLEQAIGADAKGHRFSVLLSYTSDLVTGYGDAQLGDQLRARAVSVRALEPNN